MDQATLTIWRAAVLPLTVPGKRLASTPSLPTMTASIATGRALVTSARSRSNASSPRRTLVRTSRSSMRPPSGRDSKRTAPVMPPF
jgi:hypothetical protein